MGNIGRDNIPSIMKWFRHISFFNYTYEAMVRFEVMGQNFACVSPGLPHTRYSRNEKSCPVDEAALLQGAGLDGGMGIASLLACLNA